MLSQGNNEPSLTLSLCNINIVRQKAGFEACQQHQPFDTSLTDCQIETLGKTWSQVLAERCKPAREPSNEPHSLRKFAERIESSVTLSRRVAIPDPPAAKPDLSELKKYMEPILRAGRKMNYKLLNTSQFPNDNPIPGVSFGVMLEQGIKTCSGISRETARLKILKHLNPCLYEKSLAWLGLMNHYNSNHKAHSEKVKEIAKHQDSKVLDRKKKMMENDMNKIRRVISHLKYHVDKLDEKMCLMQAEMEAFVESPENKAIFDMKKCILERMCKQKTCLEIARTDKERLTLKIERLEKLQNNLRNQVSLDYPPVCGMSKADVDDLHQHQVLNAEKNKTLISGYTKLLEKMKRETRDDIRGLRSLWTRSNEIEAHTKALIDLIQSTDPCDVVIRTLLNCLNLPPNHRMHCLTKALIKEQKVVALAADAFDVKYSEF
ncbi:unnamed protein product [Notodromas monacha]|uniref:Uncharacterized protein n=1 Tax=Notodromas monacha TaxID=399045 RepID=A0A7R9BRV6_9CRUS|nr:unnamed protein product [Notodromas monacha]CAG0920554.1 unnamed protein product [Notodromas monacha]